MTVRYGKRGRSRNVTLDDGALDAIVSRAAGSRARTRRLSAAELGGGRSPAMAAAG